MANTVSNARKNLINDAARGLISAPFFTGTTAAPSFSFQGSNYGYNTGGWDGTTPGYVNIIDKYSYTSDGNATDVGDLTAGRRYVAGLSSPSSGYTAGGFGYSPPGSYNNIIDKFPFSTDANATDVGDLVTAPSGPAGQSSETNGYVSGGNDGSFQNMIAKVSFSADGNATDIADLTVGRYHGGGHSSSTHGYTSGGNPAPVNNTIDKFPFAADANATDVGDLTSGKYRGSAQSSSTHGYNSGGADTNVLKFSFASDGNSTANLFSLPGTQNNIVNGTSSTVSGYIAGGFPPASNRILKFEFASDTSSTDVGDLTVARINGSTGQQY